MYTHYLNLFRIQAYRCGSKDGWSMLFTFKTLQAGVDWSPRFAVYGDMGNENAQSLARLQIESQERMYDAILHVGKHYHLFSDLKKYL